MAFANNGFLTMYTGPMFCGKTDMLITEIKKYQRAQVPTQSFKPMNDDRVDLYEITTRSGRGSISCTPIPQDRPDMILTLSQYADVVGIDELQFFKKGTTEVIQELVRQGKYVLVSGLDLDFRGVPFPTSAEILAVADEVHKLTAVCMAEKGCRINATRTQRFYLETGLAAPYDDAVELVQGELTGPSKKEYDYRAVCVKHHDVPGKPTIEDILR